MLFVGYSNNDVVRLEDWCNAVFRVEFIAGTARFDIRAVRFTEVLDWYYPASMRGELRGGQDNTSTCPTRFTKEIKNKDNEITRTP
jgi:hypothetical protein